MVQTRSSKGRNDSGPSSSPPPGSGSKRAATGPSSSPPAAKRGRPSKMAKEQKTIEQTINGIEDEEKVEKKINGYEDKATAPLSPTLVKRGRPSEAKEQKTIEESLKGIEDDDEVGKQINGNREKTEEGETRDKEEDSGDIEKISQNGQSSHEEKKDCENGEDKNAFEEVKSDETDVKKSAQEEQDAKVANISKDSRSIVEDDTRQVEIPSSILEKGIIYFFFRGRVGVDEPQGFEDVARSYIILRPIPLGASLGEGPLEDLGTSRLLALPKKMMPKSTRDRFLTFVEKPKATIKELREQFESNDYSTKTSGTSHVPSATPFAEGVYAITSTGRESHLAYEITAPQIGELQKELGVNEKGSYVLSVKNPQASGPANASISRPAEYPEEIQSKFRNLRWLPLDPKMLDYKHTQVLIIGEGMGVFGKALEEMSKDQKDDSKEKPEETLVQLAEEDHDRVQHLQERDPVFADLGLSAKEYSKMKSTW